MELDGNVLLKERLIVFFLFVGSRLERVGFCEYPERGGRAIFRHHFLLQKVIKIIENPRVEEKEHVS